MTRTGRALALFGAALAIAACARLQTGTDGLTFPQRRAALERLQEFEIRGRLAVDTGERAFQGRFQWRQDGNRLDLTVSGPFGAGVLAVSGTPAALAITARGETRQLTDPENQLSEIVGWWLPVASLPAWLRGLTDPTFPAVTTAGVDGTLASLEQRLWRAEFVSYQLAEADGSVLVPRRIDLVHGELSLRLTIDTFAAAPAAAPTAAVTAARARARLTSLN